MRIPTFLAGLFFLSAISCTVSELERPGTASLPEKDIFYASFDKGSNPDTRVYVDENVKLLWNKDDHISIFNHKDANDEYRFTGETGDNGGSFKLVKDFSEEGVSIDHIFAVYPYSRSTSYDTMDGTLSITFPKEQFYAVNSFGQGANAMVSATDDNMLKFRNLGGYLVLKFYGGDISVASVTLEGNKGEPLSGAATVSMEVGGNPAVSMAKDAVSSLTLTCETPVTLGTTKDQAVAFWMVVPPTDFTGGFTLKVVDSEGGVFVKETTKSLSVSRNGVLRISAIEVVTEPEEESGYGEMGEGYGLLWATCNVGAENPWEYGDYFAWGETETYYSNLDFSSQVQQNWKEGKENGHIWTSYSLCDGNVSRLNKYNTNSAKGIVDDKTELELDDDAAAVKLGGTWRMPTEEEWAALMNPDKFTWTWKTDYENTGVKGYLVTSNVSGYEGRSIFLPAAGELFMTYLLNVESGCDYWSSTLNQADGNTHQAKIMSASKSSRPDYCLSKDRCGGLPVRPVCPVSE